MVLCSFSAAQDNFPDVPEAHADYKRMRQLQQRGLLPPGRQGFHSPSRRDLALELADGIDHLGAILDIALKDANSRARGKEEIREDLYQWQDVRSRNLFGLCLHDLRADLAKAGRNPAKLAAVLDADLKIMDGIVAAWEKQYRLAGGSFFRDVPVGHWASKDIQELRDAGILVGYPDGKFLPPGSQVRGH